jgi:hypothetical protein
MATTTWTGASSTNWTSSSNWNNGSPAFGDTAVIPSSVSSGNWPTLSSTRTITQLTVNSGGQLTIATGGSLTTTGSGGSASTNAGSIFLTGGTLVNSGTFTNNSAILGRGSIGTSGTHGTITNTATGVITASGGTLNVYSVVTSGTLQVGSVSTDNLDIRTTGSSVANVSFISLSGAGSLTIESGVILTDTSASALDIGSNKLVLAGTLKVSSGAVKLEGGNIQGNGALQDGSGAAANITGYGHVLIAIVGGTVTASAGQSLYLDGLVGNSGAAASLVLQNGATLALTSAGSVGAGASPTVDLVGSGDIFVATGASQTLIHLGTISNFDSTDQIQFKAFGAGDKLVLDVANNKITLTDAAGISSQTYTFAAGTSVANIQLSDVSGVDTLTICFMTGTLVRTPDGEVAIETLKHGDLVLTSDGFAKPVNWLGKQTVSTRFADPVRSYPIRVKAGALAENVPSRDLLVSPDHALLVDGVMVHAGALVNGTSIIREGDVPEIFVYYHVELDDHSLILAENTPAETFVDNVDRMNFDNWSEFEALYPEGKRVSELPYPRAKARRQVPVYIRVALAERAEIIGAMKSAVA